MPHPVTLDEVAFVMHAPNWNPAQRIMLVSLLLMAEIQPKTGERIIHDITDQEIADTAQIKKRTVEDNIKLFKHFGIIKKVTKRGAIDEKGKRIPGITVDFEKGDRFTCKTTITIPALPAFLPVLDLEDSNAAKAKKKAAIKSKEQKQLEKDFAALLKKLKCPDCGGKLKGRLSAVCTCKGCGVVLDGDEIAEQTAKFAASLSKQTAKFAVSKGKGAKEGAG